MDYYLVQHVKGTSTFLYAGKEDTRGAAMWVQQWVDPLQQLAVQQGIGNYYSPMSYNQITYRRIDERVYLAEVDHPMQPAYPGAPKLVPVQLNQPVSLSHPMPRMLWVGSLGTS